jgi:type VI protein secretion system component VasF
MKESEIENMKKLLKDALPAARDSELRRDLWLAMLRRLDQRGLRVPWWDWALLAGLAAVLFFFPGIIPALLYHL